MADKTLKSLIIKDVATNIVDYEKYALIAFPGKPTQISIDAWIVQNLMNYLYFKLEDAEIKDKKNQISVTGIQIEVAK